MRRFLTALVFVTTAICLSGDSSAVEAINSVYVSEESYNPGYFDLYWADPNRDAFFEVQRFDGSGWSNALPFSLLQTTMCGGLTAGVYRLQSTSIDDSWDVAVSEPFLVGE